MVSGMKGQALPIVLILLALGTLLIIPSLSYASTRLIGSRISEKLMIEKYSAGAAVEDVIWRLKYNIDGLTDSISPENPTTSYSITINGIEVLIDIKIPELSDPEPPPEQQSGQHLYIAKNRDIKWLNPKESKTVTYTITVTNYGTNAMHLGEIGDIIPPPFGYVSGSSSGITTDDPVIVEENNRYKLTWSFLSPEPKIEAGESLTQSFQVSHTPGPPGTYYDEAWVVDSPASVGTVSTGATAPIAIGVYDIRAEAPRAIVRVSASISSTEVSILSWQVE